MEPLLNTPKEPELQKEAADCAVKVMDVYNLNRQHILENIPSLQLKREVRPHSLYRLSYVETYDA